MGVLGIRLTGSSKPPNTISLKLLENGLWIRKFISQKGNSPDY